MAVRVPLSVGTSAWLTVRWRKIGAVSTPGNHARLAGMATKNRSNLPDELFFALLAEGQKRANRLARQRPEKHPVVEVTTETMWDYAYQAKPPATPEGDARQALPILASNSLTKLKAAVRERGWRMAWLTCSEGMLSLGQNVIHEYPYQPTYTRRPRGR